MKALSNVRRFWWVLYVVGGIVSLLSHYDSVKLIALILAAVKGCAFILTSDEHFSRPPLVEFMFTVVILLAFVVFESISLSSAGTVLGVASAFGVL